MTQNNTYDPRERRDTIKKEVCLSDRFIGRIQHTQTHMTVESASLASVWIMLHSDHHSVDTKAVAQ